MAITCDWINSQGTKTSSITSELVKEENRPATRCTNQNLEVENEKEFNVDSIRSTTYWSSYGESPNCD